MGAENVTLARLLDRLRLLLERQPDVFGANGHRYELNEPLSEQALAEFEAQHGVRLPEDYRWFLSTVGNGGAGPYYGLFALGEVDDGVGITAWKENDGFVGHLSAPFPHLAAWNDLAGKPEETSPESAELEAEFEAFEGRYFSVRHVDGAIPICHLGCGLRIWLVISGPERGHLWLDRRPDYEGLSPLVSGSGARRRFLDWYAEWIDESLLK
jgi:hypothetical protein